MRIMFLIHILFQFSSFYINVVLNDQYYYFSRPNLFNNNVVEEESYTIVLRTFWRPQHSNSTATVNINNNAGNHAAIQIIIFAATIMLVLVLILILYRLCCTYLRRQDMQFYRSPSINSFEELIRQRLRDRPPSYIESQNSFNYSEPRVNNAILTNIPPPVYTIAIKVSNTYINDLDLPFMGCESNMDSPPSYHNSEGVINPVFTDSVTGNGNERNSVQLTYNSSLCNSEFHI